MESLSQAQRRSVERLAESKGERVCQQCGSSDLWAGEEIHRPLGNISVNLHCDNHDAHPHGAYQRFSFSLEEAEAIGIPAQRGPELHRPTGGMFPQAPD
jgi:hypothetical protein